MKADQTEQARHDPGRPPSTRGPGPDEGVRRATGRGRDEWFGLLDSWGARGRPYRESARWLTTEHGLSSWWAQKLVVEYEQSRGVRAPGARPGGTFEVSATKTLALPLDRVFAAVANAELRERWLPGASIRERISQQERSLRFDWEDGSTRVVVSFASSGETKTQVALQHQRLPDATAAEEMKAYWRERLAALKTLLEG